MKQGKLTENVLKRSVLRRIGTYREEMQKGAALGQDCAFFSWKEETLATTTQTAALPVKDAGRLVVYAADNNLAAAGAPLEFHWHLLFRRRWKKKNCRS